MAGGVETPNIAALPAIARLGTCESARRPDADRHVKLLSQFAVEGSLGRRPTTSGPPLETDIVRAGRHVSKVPKAEVAALIRSPRPTSRMN
jgi:hypothetical protein